jgi:hypothetical protein
MSAPGVETSPTHPARATSGIMANSDRSAERLFTVNFTTNFPMNFSVPRIDISRSSFGDERQFGIFVDERRLGLIKQQL